MDYHWKLADRLDRIDTNRHFVFSNDYPNTTDN